MTVTLSGNGSSVRFVRGLRCCMQSYSSVYGMPYSFSSSCLLVLLSSLKKERKQGTCTIHLCEAWTKSLIFTTIITKHQPYTILLFVYHDRLGEGRLQKDCWLLATHLGDHTKQITGTSGFKLFTMIRNTTSKHSVVSKVAPWPLLFFVAFGMMASLSSGWGGAVTFRVLDFLFVHGIKNQCWKAHCITCTIRSLQGWHCLLKKLYNLHNIAWYMVYI